MMVFTFQLNKKKSTIGAIVVIYVWCAALLYIRFRLEDIREKWITKDQGLVCLVGGGNRTYPKGVFNISATL